MISNCPVCGNSQYKPLVDLGKMPLSVLALTEDQDKSEKLASHRVDIVQCDWCSHVFNIGYDPSFTQPSVSGCTMYNSGSVWGDHLKEVADFVADSTPRDGLVVEIGAGDGGFASRVAVNKYLAFEPSDDFLKCALITRTCPRYFLPEKDVAEFHPSTIVMRHVLEHFTDPYTFLLSLSDNCHKQQVHPSLIVEVPCVEKALREGRLEDWVYEHPQHFTMESMFKLAYLSGWSMNYIRYCYGEEVLLARMTPDMSVSRHLQSDRFTTMLGHLRAASETLSHKNVVLWGGAGKSAMIINLLGLQAPVVDSDRNKWGKCVPGTRLKIMAPNVIPALNPELVVITTNWRTEDILKEMERNEFYDGRVATIKNGKLYIVRN